MKSASLKHLIPKGIKMIVIQHRMPAIIQIMNDNHPVKMNQMTLHTVAPRPHVSSAFMYSTLPTWYMFVYITQ